MNQPYEGATTEQINHPLVRQFLEIHGMFRSELAAIVQFVNELIDGSQQLSAPETQMHIRSLIQAGTRYTHYLHMHHTLESAHLFPALGKEGLDRSIINRLESEHDEIAVLIDNFSGAVRDFSILEPDVVNNDLRRLADALHAHLAYEETHLCPLLTRWSQFPM